jgi:putative ABC transport system ATP-binding protein
MTTDQSPMIETRNLVKTYKLRNNTLVKALDGVSLTIYRGEFLAIVGQSGSGKTTLLNLLGALDRPTSGEVIFEGQALNALSNSELAMLRRHKIGLVFQVFNLVPALTVAENIELPLIHTGLSKDLRSKKVETLLDAFDLTNKCSRLPSELSVGQQQKTAIARAIANDPALILADEPFGEMDPVTGREILDRLVEIKEKTKATLVIATHGALPQGSTERTILLNCGKIEKP